MVAATVVGQYTKGEYWAFSTLDTLQGAETQYTVAGSLIGDITKISYDLIVDGLSLMYFRGAHADVNIVPLVQTVPSTTYLEDFTTAAATDYKHWAPLAIPVNAQTVWSFIILNLTNAAALDIVRLSAWGRFISKPDLPLAPAPVTLDGITWPLRRRFP